MLGFLGSVGFPEIHFLHGVDESTSSLHLKVSQHKFSNQSSTWNFGQNLTFGFDRHSLYHHHADGFFSVSTWQRGPKIYTLMSRVIRPFITSRGTILYVVLAVIDVIHMRKLFKSVHFIGKKHQKTLFSSFPKKPKTPKDQTMRMFSKNDMNNRHPGAGMGGINLGTSIHVTDRLRSIKKGREKRAKITLASYQRAKTDIFWPLPYVSNKIWGGGSRKSTC